MASQPKPTPHRRREIRDFIVAQLKGATIAGDRVYPNRAKPLRGLTLPVLLVFTSQESVRDTPSDSPRLIQRAMRLQVQAIFAITEDLEDLLDDLGLQVENVLTFDPKQGGLADDTFYVEMSQGIAEDQPLAAQTLSYDVLYTTDESPIGELPVFGSAGLTWDIKPPAGTGESEPADEIDIPEE